VTGWDRDQRLIRSTGAIGDSKVRSATWSGRAARGGWIETFAVRGTDAFVIERQYSYGRFASTSLRILLPFMTRARQQTQMWRLHGSQRIDQGHSVLESSCSSDVLDDGRIACSAYDGTRTRFVAVDPATGAVAPLAMMDEHFVRVGASGGWLTGWTGSRATAVRLSSREAIRAPRAAGEWVQQMTATDAVIGTVTSIDGGSRLRVYPLTGTVPPSAASTSASR
jgi:hypothetical protein